jgi:pyruvate-formate lyase-activating enzyme
MARLPKLMISLPDGRAIEHPVLLAPVRAGDDVGVPGEGEAAIALPFGATLASLPGQRPVGIDPDTGELVVLREVKVEGKTVTPDALAAVLPPGYTRTYLPVGHRTPLSQMLPQWAYSAVGWDEKKGIVVHAIHTDKRGHWSHENHSTAELPGLVEARRDESRLTRQLAKCALEYRCFTAQNIFYAQDEGAIPASVGCNAKCIGCISEQLEDEGTASHKRMDGPPTAEEMAGLGIHHLLNARESQSGRTMVSFGQGCEGEPLTRAHNIAKSIRLMREKTDRGSININTNGSRTAGMKLLIDAGLDATRVSLNSARKSLYEAYYRPVDYEWEDVRATLKLAHESGLYIALNLLTFPGITDREGEVKAISELIGEFGVHQVQTRNLALDPEQYLAVARDTAHKSDPMGIAAMIKQLKKDHPKLVIGNYSRGLNERGDWERPVPRAATA